MVPHDLAPMRLLRIPEPFDHPDFLFEPKIDGFRALAHIEAGRCRLVSRNGNEFKHWPGLAGHLVSAFGGRSAILDGEMCCLDSNGPAGFLCVDVQAGSALLLRF